MSTLSFSANEWDFNRGAIVNYFSATDIACQNTACREAGGPGNNGNMIQSQYYVPGDDAITTYSYIQDNYSYDTLNRLSKSRKSMAVHGE